MNNRPATALTVFFLLITLAGCLPSSCKRTESRDLFPADSLSRQLAAVTVEDTLTVFGLSSGDGTRPFEYPRSIQFESTGTLLVADVGNGRINRIASDGSYLTTIDSSLTLPFLAGRIRDTTFVFDAATNVIRFIVGDSSRTWSSIQTGNLEENSVRYAVVHDGQTYLKLVPEGAPATLSTFSDTGELVYSIDLPGASWQWAGFLRSVDSSLISLRGYQPQIDIFDSDLEHDSLRLSGFDSPMLARTRSFLLGDAHAPPLLTASASFTDKYIFVLNMRPGWTRIDVFTREGTLERILTRENPSFNKEYFPTDLSVFHSGSGTYLLAVTYVKPDGRVETYEWSE